MKPPEPKHVGELDDPMHKYLCPACWQLQRECEERMKQAKALRRKAIREGR